MTLDAFPITSRYYGLKAVELKAGTRTTVYLQRRIVPQPDRFDLLEEYKIEDGDRLDNTTARFLGDPEQFWRVCDANGVLAPSELERVGRRIRITLPEGVPGPTDV